MVDHPILYSAPMMRASLAGRKTQTRRWFAASDTWDDEVKSTIVDDPVWPIGTFGQQCGHPMKLPHIMVGDRLWVREA